MSDDRISPHFSSAELGLVGVEERVRQNFQYLCEKVLEPIRAHFGRPLIVTSGFRSPEHNIAVGGVATSDHLAGEGKAAVDFIVMPLPPQALFDWIRLESALPFDQVILEYSGGIARIVHISSNRLAPGRRIAGARGTGRARDYVACEVRAGAERANV